MSLSIDSTSTNASIVTDASVPLEKSEFQHRIVDDPQKRWEQVWLWISERINPIVIKEVRQSLKSRQFTISFGLTLIAAAGWTLTAISLMVPRIFYMPAGEPLLVGFFCILTVPLMIIIPFSAFLSLTNETEDSTFELLSISALSALQIIHGKMASACVQIVLYLSALAPCIVLTYLLRGVSLYSILLVLGLIVIISVSETAIGLLMGSVARTRVLQVCAAVLLLGGIFAIVCIWLPMVFTGAMFTSFSNPVFEELLAYFASVTIVATAVSFFLRAASAAIDFPSENNSTPLRKRFLALLALIVFWVLVPMVILRASEISVVLLVGTFIVSMIYGALVTGERGVISPRAQRTLPKTFLGRVFLTWLYPGAGLGYIFLVCCYAALFTTIAIFDLYYDNGASRRTFAVVSTGYLCLCYLIIYLGVNRLVMLAVSRQLPARMMGSVALLAVTMIFAHMLPLFAVYYFNDYREFDYAWHQCLNIPWSIEEADSWNFQSTAGSLLLVSILATIIFGINLLLSTRDVMLIRVGLPPRVREEHTLAAPAKASVAADPFAE